MMEERYHATKQNRFYPDMSNVNKNITVETKLISQPTYILCCSMYCLYLCCSMYCLCVNVTVLLPPGVNQIEVNKYIE